jgi:ABC-2 type transport system ATP-binding protein
VVIDRGVVIADASPGEIKARIPSKRVSFRVTGPLPARALDGLDATRVEVAGDRVRLLSHAPETVLAVLFARGVALTDLEVAGADLEEAFLALTARAAAP